jgi:hypothetical protein
MQTVTTWYGASEPVTVEFPDTYTGRYHAQVYIEHMTRLGYSLLIV